MRSTDEVKVMTIEKFRYNIGPEGKRYAAIILAPSLHVLVGIWPQQVAQEPGVWDISGSHDSSDLFHGLEIRAQASMATKDFLVHNGRDRKTIEAVGEGLPKLDIKTPFAFVVEPVDPVNTGALVVAS